MKRILPVLSRPLRAGILALALGSAAALMAAPSWISRLNYQGQLTDNLGEPVADGSYSVDFRIYQAASGGVAIWSETQNVTVAKGLFNVVLGSVNSINLTVPQATDDLWIAIEVNSNGEMSPRQQLLPAVYAWNAERLNGYSVGTGADNIVKLDGSGKIPASMISGGSVGAPLDVAGSSASYVLRANNTGTGMALSVAASSTTQPALFAEGGKFGVVAKTNDAAQGVALQAFGPSSAYASLVDRVNNAQVFGQANAVNYLGVLGVNTNGSGTGVHGSGGGTGVSATGGTWGVQATGGTYGIQATGGTYGVYAQATSASYGVYATAPAGGIGVAGTGTWGVYGFSSIGTSNSRGVYGLYNGASSGSGVYGRSEAAFAGTRGVWGQASNTTVLNYGVYGETGSTIAGSSGVYGINSAATGVNYGAYGQSASTTLGSAGVNGRATAVTGNSAGVRGETASSSGYGVLGVATSASGYAFGVRGESSAATGYGVSGIGYYGVIGESTNTNGYGVHGYTTYGGGAGVFAGSESSTSPGLLAQNTEGGIAIRAQGDPTGVSATGTTYGVWAEANSPSGYAGAFYNNAASTNGTALFAQGYYYGMEVGTSYAYGYGIRSTAYTAYEGAASSGGINYYSNAANLPSFGFYHSRSSAGSGSYAAYLRNELATAYGVYVENDVPTAADGGYALRVKGKFQAPDCAGLAQMTSGIATQIWTVTSATTGVGTAGANCIESGSTVIVTSQGTTPYLLSVSAVSAGSFTVRSSASLTALNFYYWVINE